MLYGQIDWVATHIGPGRLYECCEFASLFRNEFVADISKTKRMVKKIKKTSSFIQILKLASTDNHTLIAYHDASYANLKDGSSQEGCEMSLTDNNSKYMPSIAL